MSRLHYERLEAVFTGAVERTGRSRDDYLRDACAGDPKLRHDVELLLKHDGGGEATTALDRCGLGRELLASEIADQERSQTHQKEAQPAFVGPYTIRSKIAEGGMGVVYLAEQNQPRRRVALKVIRSGIFTDELLRRFEFEADLLGRLQHPGIAGIYDAGEAETETGRQPYFAMEYVEGVPLTEHAERARLSKDDRLELLARICDAVHHAHQHGIVHRDLKPGNILVVDDQSHDAIGQPKVLDFGVSRLIRDRPVDAQSITRTGYVVGTVAYMSPEQAGGEKNVDTRSDVYSLGVIAFELLSGRLPHDCRELPFVSALRMVREQPTPRLASTCADCRGDVSIIVDKALAPDRERRYASAAALADDIRRYLAHEPIAARPPTIGYQLNRFVRRNKAIVLGGTIAVLSLMIGLALALVSQREEARQRLVAERQGAAAEQAAYAALVQLAARYRASGDTHSARRRLDATPAHLRGWEWEYLSRSLEDEMSFVPLSADIWTQSTLTADETLAVLPVGERVLRVVDLVAGEWTEHAIPFPVLGAALLLDDSRTALVSDPDFGVVRLDLTGEREHQPLFASAVPICQMARAPDARSVVFTTMPSDVTMPGDGHVVDIVTGEAGAHLERVCPATALDVSPDGSLVVIGEHAGGVAVYDFATGALRHEVEGEGHRVRCIRFSPTGRRFASTDAALGIRVWDTQTASIERVIDAPQYAATTLRFFPDDDTLFSGHESGRIRRWDVTTGECTWMTSGGERAAGVNHHLLQLAFPAGDGVVYAVGCDGLSSRPAHAPLPTVLHHEACAWPFAYDVVFSPDGERMTSCGWDGKVRVWDAATREPVTVLDSGATVHFARYSPDGARLFVDVGQWYTSHRLELWDARTFERVAATEFEGRQTAGLFLPGGDEILVGGRHQLCVLDGHTLARVESRTTHSEVWTLAISPDGTTVACGLDDGTLLLFDTGVWEPRARIAAHDGRVSGLAFSPDSSRLASGAADAALCVWDAATGKRVWRVESPECIETLSLTYTPDGNRIVVGSRYPAIRIRDAATGSELLALEGHTDYVRAVAFSPDHRILASASGDNTVRIWDSRPLVERVRARDERREQERAALPRIQRLLGELGTLEAVLMRVADDPAAHNVALRMRP